MVDEELKPKLPIYDTEGKVRDERIAREMANKEMEHRAPFLEKGIPFTDAAKGRSEGYAEQKGMHYYQEHGVEISASDLPEEVREVFEATLKKHRLTISNPSQVDLRRIDSSSKPEFVMDYRFLQTGKTQKDIDDGGRPGWINFRQTYCDGVLSDSWRRIEQNDIL